MQTPAETKRPILSGGIVQKFWPLGEQLPEDCSLEYRPGLACEVKLHFVQAKADLDYWRSSIAVQNVSGRLPQPVWQSAMLLDNTRPLEDSPTAGAEFAELPPNWPKRKTTVGGTTNWSTTCIARSGLSLGGAPCWN